MSKRIDLAGQRFGLWTVLSYAEKRGNYLYWNCRCDCGTERVVSGNNLKSGQSTNCGCVRLKFLHEELPKITTKNGAQAKGKRERLYGIYCDMKSRCYSETSHAYHNYGGRGITACDEWLGEYGYNHFRDWAYANGYDPEAPRGQYTLDRIDVNGNYSPENCRWVDMQVQANNTRYNVRIEYNGETHTLAEWGRITGIGRKNIRGRLQYGWSVERALTEPVDITKRSKKYVNR